jgi:hypothetical protein
MLGIGLASIQTGEWTNVVKATGGTETTFTAPTNITYKVHTYNYGGANTMSFTNQGRIDYIIVGSGGGGGGSGDSDIGSDLASGKQHCGGGGGGGRVENDYLVTANQSYTFDVAFVLPQSTANVTGFSGYPSTAFSSAAGGGGAGGKYNVDGISTSGLFPGSGGGGGAAFGVGGGGVTNGGDGWYDGAQAGGYAGGAGGGAGGNGNNAIEAISPSFTPQWNTSGGKGGAGQTFTDYVQLGSVTYGAGGGGGRGGLGGDGGGGDGSPIVYGTVAPAAGSSPGSGGGGAAGTMNAFAGDSGMPGGNGAEGIIQIRYRTNP